MNSQRELDAILSKIKSSENVQKMHNYIQHGSVSTFEHCEYVAKLSYLIDKYFLLHSVT